MDGASRDVQRPKKDEHRVRVLLVEDEEGLAASLKRGLHADGFVVEAVVGALDDDLLSAWPVAPLLIWPMSAMLGSASIRYPLPSGIPTTCATWRSAGT